MNPVRIIETLANVTLAITAVLFIVNAINIISKLLQGCDNMWHLLFNLNAVEYSYNNQETLYYGFNRKTNG